MDGTGNSRRYMAGATVKVGIVLADTRSIGRGGPTIRARMTSEGAALSASSPEDRHSSVHMDAVRKLELKYRRTTPGKAELVVEFVGGRIKVFEVDKFFIERLLEQLEDREA